MRNVISAVCIKCGAEIEPTPNITVCPHCGGLLDIKYDYKYIASRVTAKSLSESRDYSMWRYREFLPVEEDTKNTPLRVGYSPFYEVKKLAEMLDIGRLWIKDDGINPTASLK